MNKRNPVSETICFPSFPDSLMDDLAREIQDMNQSLDRFIEKERVRLATRVMQYDCLKHYFRQTGRHCKQKVLKINGHRSGGGEGSCPKGQSPSSQATQNAVKARGGRQEAVGALPHVPEEAARARTHGDRYRNGGDGRRGESMTTPRSLPAGGAHLPADGANFQHAQTSRSASDGNRSSGAEPRGCPESIGERVCVRLRVCVCVCMCVCACTCAYMYVCVCVCVTIAVHGEKKIALKGCVCVREREREKEGSPLTQPPTHASTHTQHTQIHTHTYMRGVGRRRSRTGRRPKCSSSHGAFFPRFESWNSPERNRNRCRSGHQGAPGQGRRGEEEAEGGRGQDATHGGRCRVSQQQHPFRPRRVSQ